MKESKCRIIAIQAENHALLKGMPVDLVFNIVPMGEMGLSTIADYFDDIRAKSSSGPLYYYCCNRIEKALPDGTKSRFFEYPWPSNDELLIEELCP